MSFSFNPLTDPFFELYPLIIQDRKRRGTRFSIGNPAQILKRLTITDELIDRLTNKKKKQEEDKKIIIDFLTISNLMTKIEKESNENEKVSIEEICSRCVDNLQYEKVSKGSFLYKITDPADKCFFLLRGKLDELVPKQNAQKYCLSYHEYLLYLHRLRSVNETYIFNEVLKANFKTIPFESFDDYRNFTDCYIKQKIRQLLIDEELTPDSINQIFIEFGKTHKDFRMDDKEIEAKYKLFSQMKDFNYNWSEYILKYTKSSVEELAFFDRMRNGRQRDMNTKLEIIGVKYEKSTSFNPGDFFGDDSLEEEKRVRSSSIQAEVNCVLGFMKYDDYIQLIFPKQKKTKLKIISFLFDNYFFSSISQSLFDKYYLHYFKQYDCMQKGVVYMQNSPLTDLKFIKQGLVKVTLQCSIIEMHNLIKFIVDKLIEIKPKLKSFSELNDLKKEYLNDFDLLHMKNKHIKDFRFSSEMQKKQVFQLYHLKENDIIGLEEVFLGANSFSTSIVSSDNLSCLSIEFTKLKKILIEEKSSIQPYTEMACNKIYSLLSRIHQIKCSYIDYYQTKLHKEAIIEDSHWGKSTLNPKPKKYDFKNKIFLNCVNAYCYDDKQPIDVIKGTPKTMRFSFNNDCNVMNKIKKMMLNSNKKPIQETLIEVKDDMNNPNNDINDNIRPNNIIASFSTPNMHSSNMKINSKTQSTLSFDIKCRNNYLTINSIQKQFNLTKYYYNPIMKKSVIEGNEIKNEGTNVLSNYNFKTIPLKKVSLIDMGKTANDMYNSTPSTQRLPYIPQMRYRTMNKGLRTKLKNYDPRCDNENNNSHNIYNDYYDKTNIKINAPNNDVIKQIEEYFAMNIENDGSNIITGKIKDYYRNQKFIGYSNLGLGKNTFHIKNRMFNRNYKRGTSV